MEITKQQHLQNVLETHRMAHIDSLLSKYQNKREEVKEFLEQEYSDDKIYSPFNSGSYAKHTAINSKFDLDIVVPYKRNSFETLQLMFDSIYDILNEKYKNIATVRKQKVSIGLEFYADKDNDVISLDIVPGRELSKDDYKDSKDLNLMFNESTGSFGKNSYIKTNIQSQIEHIKGKNDERKIIRLLKIWKNGNNEKYKSFLLELITIKAFDKTDITGNLWEMLKSVMEYIRDNITKDNFTLKDPGNSNNDVIKTLEDWERTNLANRMDTIIRQIENCEDNIKTYFPINEDFDTEKTNDNSYGIKGTTISPSIPSNNQRFG